MAASLFEHGSIRTTVVKAKELRGFVEKLITIAKQGDLHARRRVIAELQDRHMAELDENGDVDFDRNGLALLQEKTVVQKLFDEIAPRYAERNGGYTRIIRVSERRIGDAGEQCVLMLVGEDEAPSTGGGSSRRKQRAQKRHAALKAAGVGKASAAAATATEEAPAEPEDAPVENAAEEAPVEEAGEQTPETNESGDEDKAE
jgi:large subunit ribosomal protein L17